MAKDAFKCSTPYVRDEYDIYTYANLHVPMGCKEVYSAAYEWRYFNKIKEDMEMNGKVYYAKLMLKQGTTGYTEQNVKADEAYTLYIGSLGDNRINSVTFNGKDVTDMLVNGYYTTPEIKGPSTLSVSYETNIANNVKELSASSIRVTGDEGVINVSSIDEPSDISVYDTNGRLIETKKGAIGSAAFFVSGTGVYVVKVGARSFKLAM